MKIVLLSDSKSEVNILPKLKEKLLGQIADAEVSQHFVHSPSDLPLKAKQLSQNSKLVFVFSDCEKEDARMVVSKLVDIEVQTGTRIIKAIGEEEPEESLLPFGLDSGTAEPDSNELATKWSKHIITVLFHPEKIVPSGKSR